MWIHKITGIKITDQQYLYDLDSFEKMEYVRSVESESKTSSSRDIIDTIVDVGIGIAIGSLFDDESSTFNSDYSSSSDSSGFSDDFGGGDFSGGGSGGDW